MAKKKEINVEQLLSAADAKETKKKKSDIPIFDVPHLANAIGDFNDAKDAILTAESKKANCESIIFPEAEKLRIRASQEAHEFMNSVKLNSPKGCPTFTQKNAFSTIPATEKPRLQRVCEDEKVEFSKHFESYPDISLVDDLTKDQLDDVVQKLAKAFGKDFTAFFKVKYPVRVLPSFIRDVIFDENVGRVMNRLGPDSPDPIIKPYKPSLR